MLGHPSKPELLAYAEGLVDGRGISAATARHMNACPVCAREVAAIRESIAFAASANTLDPSEESVSRILIAARTERKATKRARGGTPMLLLKGLAYAAGVAVVSAVVFQAGLNSAGINGLSRTASASRTMTSTVSPEDMRRTSAQIETFVAAVGSRKSARPTYKTWQQAREVLAIDAALTAAREELQTNPANERANRVIASNLKRQASALKSLYMERSL